jgi:hypothetical protein
MSLLDLLAQEAKQKMSNIKHRMMNVEGLKLYYFMIRNSIFDIRYLYFN